MAGGKKEKENSRSHHSHFEGKDPLAHVKQKKTQGMLTIIESHGTEMPGAFAAGTDSARETSLFLALLAFLLTLMQISFLNLFYFLCASSLGWLFWKTSRSAWLGWSRLERLHRTIEQEKYEIETHRPQEREELIALYTLKGFEGKLLEDVVNVLMADQDRLLKVMLEEEMGYTLEAYEHPLKQASGAALGTCLAAFFCLLLFFFSNIVGIAIATFICVGISTWLMAWREKNDILRNVVWMWAITLASISLGYTLLKLLLH